MFYQPLEVEFCFAFKSPNEKLQLLVNGVDFHVDEDRLIFVEASVADLLDENDEVRITVRFKHNPTFHILDINREIVKSFSYDERFDEDKKRKNSGVAGSPPPPPPPEAKSKI